MEKNLVDLSKDLLVNIEKIDDLVDEYFAPIKDYTDTVSDIFAPIKLIHSFYTIQKKRKFKSFLKSYSQSLNTENFESEISIERLKAYLKNEKNFDFLTETIENAINSKSVYGSILLGFYAGQILSNEQVITFKDTIIIEALKSLNDYEFSCFARIYNVAHPGAEEITPGACVEEKDLKFFCRLTVEKLVQLRVVERSRREGMYDWQRTFVSTDVAEDIFVYIESTNILEELLKYKI